MPQAIWASLEDWLPPDAGFKLVGRNVANHGFFKALLKYAPFDEFHVFLHNRAHKRAFLDHHAVLLDDLSDEARLRIFYRSELPEALRAFDYTVFHQGDHLGHFNALCHLRNRYGGFPVTAFIHALSDPRDLWAYQEMTLGGLTASDGIICSSESGKRVVRAHLLQAAERLGREVPEPALEVIPFGLDPEDFPRLDRNGSRGRLGISPEERVALCFGRFSEYDKMDLFPLLQAFHRILPAGAKWRLVLAGAAHSPQYAEMVRLWARALDIEEAVTVRTNVQNEEKRAWFSAADFFVSPSDNLQETFGMTLIEAMAAGLPLVVSDFDGYRDLATPDVAFRIPTIWADVGLPEPVGALLDEAVLFRYLAQSVCVDIDRMAHAMRELFLDPKKCEEMGRKARHRFERTYDYRAIIPRMCEFWFGLKRAFNPRYSRAGADPPSANYFRTFSHYVTEELTPETVLKATRFAESLDRMGLDYPLFPDMEQFVEIETVRGILYDTRRPKTVAEILSSTDEAPRAVRYQVLWMLKHGLLEVA